MLHFDINKKYFVRCI